MGERHAIPQKVHLSNEVGNFSGRKLPERFAVENHDPTGEGDASCRFTLYWRECVWTAR